MGLASESLYDLWVVLEAWEKGVRHVVERVAKEKEEAGGTENRA